MTFNGDPTVVGWVTFLLYVISGYLCWKQATEDSEKRLRGVWLALGVSLLFLGINKEMDLHEGLVWFLNWLTAQTSISAPFAIKRAALGFLLTLAVCAAFYARRSIVLLFSQNKEVAAGVALVLLYILARTSSVAHFDDLLGFHLYRIHYQWIVEISGLLLVIHGLSPAYLSHVLVKPR